MQISSPLTSEWRLNAELLGYVVWRLFPQVKLIGGGVNSIGFYYDFIFLQPFAKEMMELIEVEMYRFIKEDHPVRYHSMMRENAANLFVHHGQAIFAENAKAEECNIVELLQVGNFYSLCPILDLSSTLDAGHFKLLDCQTRQEGETITRLIGTSRPYAKELKTFIKSYDAFLKKRDHRTLGPQLNLFSFAPEMGALGVIWHPKGMQLLQILKEMERKANECHRIETPIALRDDFFHSDEELLEPFVFDEDDYFLRPSFLLQHLQIFKHLSLDPDELPWKLSEMGSVFTYIPESQRWGLFSICSYSSDLTTTCCKKEQVIFELISSLHFIEQIITLFGLKTRWILVAGQLKSPNKRGIGQSIEWLKQAFCESKSAIPFDPDLVEEGQGMTRLELRVTDSLGREWTLSKIEVLTANPKAESSDLVFIARQLWTSLERFVAILLEHFEGVLPFWLVPEQIRVMAIGEGNRDYAKELSSRLNQEGLRVKLDLRQSKLSARIHEAERENVPYLLLVGEQERLKQKISVRETGKSSHNTLTDLETFLKEVNHKMPKMEKMNQLES